MNFLDGVTLIKPFQDLKVGTEGFIVDKYNEDYYEVEFIDENGDTIDVYTISKDYLKLDYIYTRNGCIDVD